MKFMVELDQKDIEDAIKMLLAERGLTIAKIAFSAFNSGGGYGSSTVSAKVEITPIPKIPEQGPYRT